MKGKATPYRSGPWPGITPRGAGILLALAAFLAVGQLLIGPLQQPIPDLVLLGVTALIPLAIAERIVRAPGAATAVCGAYLMPRATLSLLAPGIPPPPLLLVPAIAFDVVLWLSPAHLPNLRGRRRVRTPLPEPSRTRSLLAGAAFGVVLALVEPAYQVFVGASPATWSGPPVWIAAAITTLVCAGLATVVTAPDRAS